ncbi:putative NBD/HSP70 family sugar kinase [Kribbella sp. VKM Ac-2527]|uniref:Putative NBD/HSP70 family sugar kinase n=1 Tax=Kribbella caucasensis TaxID=2512215 RepID=A0A4R6KHD6_9ACTN|nr:ROK family transcriptional regulator [Kribbella sp. VKM Ac-2527]TDO49887.1 putative NBD/HSP70 family sugar kinase [Kribbella sp. VKM Ac-2527]
MAVSGTSERPVSERGLTAGELAVTRQLLIHGPATRGDLGDRLNLSYASMSRLARALIGGGIASEDLESAAAIGRPRQILAAVPSARHVVGVKLTADTAFGVVCDMFGDVKATTKAALPEPGEDGVVPVGATVKVVTQLANRLARKVPSLDGIGVAVGGVVADRSVVREGTFLGWREVDLAGQLKDRTGLPVIVTNDVTALAREQLWFGAGRTHSTFGVITVGAGFGVGVVREGVAIEELIDNGHLLAHAPIDSSGPRCGIGHSGCAAAYLNREDLERNASAAVNRPVTLDDLVRARAVGDEVATRWLDGAARALGHVVASFAGALQTTCIVLAGEDVAAFADSAALREVIADRLRPGPLETQRCTLDIVTTPLTFTDWARGAAVAGIQNVLGA